MALGLVSLSVELAGFCGQPLFSSHKQVHKRCGAISVRPLRDARTAWHVLSARECGAHSGNISKGSALDQRLFGCKCIPGPEPAFRHEVLEDISLKIDGDSSCALMGPSGSGKSSLLNVLTGRALLYGEVSGRLFANGEPIPEGIEAKCKNAAGFVPQDDVMHTNLTVYENVYFSARLRLPPDTEARDVVDTVEQVLKDVGIWHVKDTPVGNADLRGISGGQRKRASIAMELVGRPSVLFLDEPTSGLDASAAHSIITRLSSAM